MTPNDETIHLGDSTIRRPLDALGAGEVPAGWVPTADGQGGWAWGPAPNGGSADGVPRIVKCPFAFDTPGILTGAALWTPAVGDLLIDAWLDIVTAWNGTSPIGDFGVFNDGPPALGIYAGACGAAADMTNQDGGVVGTGTEIGQHQSVLSAFNTLNTATSYLEVSGTALVHKTIVPADDISGRIIPGAFLTTDPIKFCVSQDGTPTGADPGATAGEATLYLTVATPAAG
jgi:hypothetical protein